jgi:hypothetical protein
VKLLIFGSRSYSNQLITVVTLLDELVFGGYDDECYPVANELHKATGKYAGDITEVISGCASGIDHAAIVWADNHSIPCTKMPANWKQYGITAGFKRNEEMGKLCDYAIGIWDGKSRGTQHMVSVLDKLDKEYLIWDKLPVRKFAGSGIVAVAM